MRFICKETGIFAMNCVFILDKESMRIVEELFLARKRNEGSQLFEQKIMVKL